MAVSENTITTENVENFVIGGGGGGEPVEFAVVLFTDGIPGPFTYGVQDAEGNEVELTDYSFAGGAVTISVGTAPAGTLLTLDPTSAALFNMGGSFVEIHADKESMEATSTPLVRYNELDSRLYSLDTLHAIVPSTGYMLVSATLDNINT